MHKALPLGTLALLGLLSSPAVQAEDAVKHRFLATDSGKARLLYVDQFHPENDWSAATPPGPRPS